MFRHIHIYPCRRRGNSSGNHITSLNHSYTPLLRNSLIFLSILFFSTLGGLRRFLSVEKKGLRGRGKRCKAEQYGKEEKHPGISHARQRNFNFVPSLWNKFERDSFRCIYTLLLRRERERERSHLHPLFSSPVILHAYEYGRNAANPKNGVQELTGILLKRGQGRI